MCGAFSYLPGVKRSVHSRHDGDDLLSFLRAATVLFFMFLPTRVPHTVPGTQQVCDRCALSSHCYLLHLWPIEVPGPHHRFKREPLAQERGRRGAEARAGRGPQHPPETGLCLHQLLLNA